MIPMLSVFHDMSFDPQRDSSSLGAIAFLMNMENLIFVFRMIGRAESGFHVGWRT